MKIPKHIAEKLGIDPDTEFVVAERFPCPPIPERPADPPRPTRKEYQCYACHFIGGYHARYCPMDA